MAPKHDDGPALILRVTPRGLVPAAAIDEETLSAMRPGTELLATTIKVVPSKALRAWWALMDAVVKADDRWPASRALSNTMLIELGASQSELLLRGGVRNEPMSLKTFTETELWDLVERAKLLVVTVIFPGADLFDITGYRE